MSRAKAILAVLASLVLVLVAAWWVGRTEAGPAAGLASPGGEVADAAIDPRDPGELDAEADSEGTGLASEPGPGERAAIAPTPEGVASDRSAAPAGALRPRGRVVDERTSEPLPGYVLDLRDPHGVTSRVTTDAQGAFEAGKALAPGALAICAFERGPRYDLAAELVPDGQGAAAPFDLRVATGPTYRLVLTPAGIPAIEEFHARFSLRTPRGPIRASAALLADEPPWVRCGPVPDDAQADAELVLESKDGVWEGRANVRLGTGRQAGVVRVDLQALAALDVRVVDDAGAALEEASVTWRPLAPEGNAAQGTTRRDGRVEFDRLKPEAGTLVVRLVRWVDAEIPLVLAQGEARPETVTLVRAPSAGPIRGTVVSDSGAYDRDVYVRLVPLDLGRGVRGLGTQVRWGTKGGARVGAFEFDDLPLGKFRLEVAEDDFYAWEPRRLDVEAPRSDVVLVVKDAIACADLAFEPRAEDGSAFPEPFEVRLAAAGETRVLRGRDGILVVPGFPIDAPLRWRIDAPGRAAAFGAWPGLAPLPSVAGRERRGAAPILARGWSQSFRVVRSDNRRGIEGARARIDGVDAGATDGQGRIVLRADARPRRVAFAHEGWRQLDAPKLAPERGSPEYESTVRLEVPKTPRKKKP